MDWTNLLVLSGLAAYLVLLLRLQTQTIPRPPHRAA